MTYEGMKPMTPVADRALADWIKAGGALVFVDDDRDPYNKIKGCWNAAGVSNPRSPREALFERIGLGKGLGPGEHRVGKGIVIFDTSSPAGLSHKRDGAAQVQSLVRQACKAIGLDYREAGHMVLRRGPYVIAAGLEGSTGAPTQELRLRFVDLFDSRLPVVTSVRLNAGSRSLLVDVDRTRSGAPAVLAAACRVSGEKTTPQGGMSFTAAGPRGTTAAVRVGLTRRPGEVTVDRQPIPPADQEWDEPSGTLLIRFSNSANGREVAMK
jgi:hypothetical protein